ncbi:MAG: cytochrome c biogenesis protein CcsA, partial [Campylobacteraceae bacterium]|nr:cytochrome c biogenesis protein CcsA [Campylobacteraceae bacterium]
FIGVLFFSPNVAIAQEVSQDMLKMLSKYDKEHADHFGTILVQSVDGRIKPIDTLSREIFNKVYRKEAYEGINSNQLLLAMITDAQRMQWLPLIKVTHPELKKIVGIDQDMQYASYVDFLNLENGQYKLLKYAEAANRKRDAERNQFDKDVIKVDERLYILLSTYNLDMFKMVPKIGDENNRWFSVISAVNNFNSQEASDVRTIFITYFDAVEEGLKTGNWKSANEIVDIIKQYQMDYASKIIPSQKRIGAELFFNKARIFDRLTAVYLICGFMLLILVFVKMIFPKVNIKTAVKLLFYLCLVAFVAHTFGLGLRWYIAQHAPWSNSYESMIYIAWAIALAGLFFSRTSVISMSLTYILGGITLFVAHLSWMDATITNLVPVLKSYWLTIHVSVITASYGFLGLCSLLGFFVLVLYILKVFKKSGDYKENIERNITEATRINEMSMILGLSLLTIGNFLGGVWANESWGRYWGWDPKETWSLISILIYSIIVHIRFVPKLNNQLVFAILSTIAYASIMMTYFGVNFYLSGKHSYASGDPVPVHTSIYWIAFVVVSIVVGAVYCAYRESKIGRLVKKL